MKSKGVRGSGDGPKAPSSHPLLTVDEGGFNSFTSCSVVFGWQGRYLFLVFSEMFCSSPHRR